MTQPTILEKISALKQRIRDSLNGESTKEQIAEVEELCNQLDSISKDGETLINDKREVTELYVKAMKSAGSQAEIDDGVSGDTSKSLEECMQEVLSKEEKK